MSSHPSGTNISLQLHRKVEAFCSSFAHTRSRNVILAICGHPAVQKAPHSLQQKLALCPPRALPSPLHLLCLCPLPPRLPICNRTTQNSSVTTEIPIYSNGALFFCKCSCYSVPPLLKCNKPTSAILKLIIRGKNSEFWKDYFNSNHSSWKILSLPQELKTKNNYHTLFLCKCSYGIRASYGDCGY